MITGASFQPPDESESDVRFLSRITLATHTAPCFRCDFRSSSCDLAAQQPALGAGFNHPGRIRQKVHPRFWRLRLCFNRDRLKKRKRKFRNSLRSMPSVEGYNLLGIVYSSQKDYDNALEAFQHALKIDPNSTKTANNLGNLYVSPRKTRPGREGVQKSSPRRSAQQRR